VILLVTMSYNDLIEDDPPLAHDDYSDIQGMAPSPGPVSFSVSVPGDLAEMLPSYLDNLDAFDKKMETLGMKRSVTQFNTPANGNCGPEGIYPN